MSYKFYKWLGLKFITESNLSPKCMDKPVDKPVYKWWMQISLILHLNNIFKIF